VLAFYRSQHDNQSWVAALTTILDTCALVISGIQGVPPRPARLTFAMARHALADLTSVLGARPQTAGPDRLSDRELERLHRALVASGITWGSGAACDERLRSLRRQYEPYAQALSELLLMALPPWLPPEGAKDNWETTA